MNLPDDIVVKKHGGEYKIEYCAPVRICGSKTPDYHPPTKSHKAYADAFDEEKDEDEPEGYISKSVSTSTSTCNGKTTKTITKEYKFADGSSQSFSKTVTEG